MRDTDWTPSIVPGDEDRDTCLVVNDFGLRGRAWCETDVEAADLETVIQDLLDGQYWHPVRVVSFNTGEGWARDISADVAEELRRPASINSSRVFSSCRPLVVVPLTFSRADLLAASSLERRDLYVEALIGG
jgi:hypothetical protein